MGKWRFRFAKHCLDGLLDEPRPGTPHKIGDDAIAETIRLTLADDTPPEAMHGFAVDDDHLGRRTGQRGDPGDETALESLGVERRKNVAQLIVRWRPVAERPEAAQKLELPFAELRDIGERLRTRQHRQKTEKQNLVERIDHLAALPMIRQLVEIAKKHNRPGKSSVVRHRRPSSSQKITTDSSLQPIVTPFFTRSPWRTWLCLAPIS